MSTFTLAAALFLLFTAAGVIWLNPRRFSNQAFSLVSTILAAWLGCVYQAMKAGAIIAQGGDANLVYWLRNINLVAAFLPGSIWLQMVATIESNALTRKIIIRAIPWTLLATFLCFLTFHNTFAEKGSDGRLTRGSAYILYTTLGICAFGACLYQAFTKYSELKGIRRVELQFLSFSVAFAGLLLGLFNTLGSIFDIRFLNRSSIVVIFGSYIIIAGALIFHRVFNARQVFAFLAQKVALAITLCLGILYLPTTISPPLPTTLAQLVSILFCSAGVLWLNGPSKRWLGIDNDEMIAKLRRSLINLSLEESNTDKRRDAWERLLVEHFSASEIIVHSHDKSAPGRRSLSLSRSSAAYHCLAKASWATPESLQRQRSSPASQELRDFLVAQSLGVAVAVPRGSPNPSLIVALGIKTNDAPFTYPEVLRLQNIAELLDSMLTRSQLSTQAALQAKMEHLAMMSRGLAHDLKNLITPISSYLLHTKARHQFGTLESGVHESAQRSVNVMNDYVREALLFSENMALNYESVHVGRVFADVRAITSSRGEQAGVRIETVITAVEFVQADEVLLQRMLANLVANAIDASPRGSEVIIHIEPGSLGWTRLQVIDHGCGIPAEHLERIFDPYFTTKEFGETMRGFGLGLTITQKIVQLHQGKISVQSVPGRGATITIDLPESPQGMTPAGRIEELASTCNVHTNLHQ